MQFIHELHQGRVAFHKRLDLFGWNLSSFPHGSEERDHGNHVLILDRYTYVLEERSCEAFHTSQSNVNDLARRRFFGIRRHYRGVCIESVHVQRYRRNHPERHLHQT